MKKTPYLKKDMTIFILFYKKIFNNDFHRYEKPEMLTICIR